MRSSTVVCDARGQMSVSSYVADGQSSFRRRRQNVVRFSHLLLVLSLCLPCAAVGEDRSRIQCRGKINGEPVVLELDTGAELSVLFRETAERLGLEVKWPSANVQVDPGKVALGVSEECLLEAGQLSTRTRFGIVRLPGYIRHDTDGVIGWGGISENI